jgi:aspartate/methionine/tyrosine aminotransferase
VQAAAVAVLADEAHVAENRRLYDEKFAVAEDLLGDLFGALTPPGGFFLWLDVSRWGDDVAVVERLWRDTGVKTVPGSYLTLTGPGGNNPGVGRIRLALVADAAVTLTALTRLRDFLMNAPEGEMRGSAHGGA